MSFDPYTKSAERAFEDMEEDIGELYDRLAEDLNILFDSQNSKGAVETLKDMQELIIWYADGDVDEYAERHYRPLDRDSI